MRTACISALLLLSFLSPLRGQTSRSSRNASIQTWQQFLSLFRSAARAHDRQVLRTMITRYFEWAGVGGQVETNYSAIFLMS